MKDFNAITDRILEINERSNAPLITKRRRSNSHGNTVMIEMPGEHLQ